MIKKISSLIYFLALLTFFNTSTFATSVLIWDKDGNENPYGHAAVQTRTYHMSLWPDGDVKRDFGTWNTLTNGCRGALNYHHHVDCILERGRKPKIYTLEGISEYKVNSAYEEMLHYNDITPDTVTLEAAQEKLNKGVSLYGSVELGSKYSPEITLKRSLYTYLGINHGKDEFYKYKQSCTSFSLSVLKNGGFKYAENIVRPIVVTGRHGSHSEAVYVWSFEQAIKNYISGDIEHIPGQGDCNIQ